MNPANVEVTTYHPLEAWKGNGIEVEIMAQLVKGGVIVYVTWEDATTKRVYPSIQDWFLHAVALGFGTTLPARFYTFDKGHDDFFVDAKDTYLYLIYGPPEGLSDKYVIVCVNDRKLFWSNACGWVGRESRDTFSFSEVGKYTLPNEGEWQNVKTKGTGYANV